jgi:hypothetical protein
MLAVVESKPRLARRDIRRGHGERHAAPTTDEQAAALARTLASGVRDNRAPNGERQADDVSY